VRLGRWRAGERVLSPPRLPIPPLSSISASVMDAIASIASANSWRMLSVLRNTVCNATASSTPTSVPSLRVRIRKAVMVISVRSLSNGGSAAEGCTVEPNRPPVYVPLASEQIGATNGVFVKVDRIPQSRTVAELVRLLGTNAAHNRWAGGGRKGPPVGPGPPSGTRLGGGQSPDIAGRNIRASPRAPVDGLSSVEQVGPRRPGRARHISRRRSVGVAAASRSSWDTPTSR
jgi:hypothetical protein